MKTCYCDADSSGKAPVKSLPVLINADGIPLGVSLSEARHVIALDGHVYMVLPTVANDTLTLKLTSIEGLLHASFVSSRVFGHQVVAGSTIDCLYQVTVVGDDKGQGLLNLCDNLVNI